MPLPCAPRLPGALQGPFQEEHLELQGEMQWSCKAGLIKSPTCDLEKALECIWQAKGTGRRHTKLSSYAAVQFLKSVQDIWWTGRCLQAATIAPSMEAASSLECVWQARGAGQHHTKLSGSMVAQFLKSGGFGAPESGGAVPCLLVR